MSTKKKINYDKLSGQALSDATAKMLGWAVVNSGSVWVGMIWVKNGKRMWGKSTWRPHCLYDQCRVVEDFIYQRRLWAQFIAGLPRRPGFAVKMRSTCEERLRAALKAWQDSRRGKK